jgi:hypothetical protein
MSFLKHVKPSIRNRWTSHLFCIALGAALCAAAWLAVDAYHEVELSQSLEGRWTLDAKHADPSVAQVDVEYRPDGTFMVWQTHRDGCTRIVEHGRWWVSGRHLLQEYDSVDGRPVPNGAQPRPETKTVIRADQTLVLAWPAGFLYQYRRA